MTDSPPQPHGAACSAGTPARVALIAPGNPGRGDDAIGPLVGERVVALLRARDPRATARSLALHSGPLDALAIVDAWTGASTAFVVDAALWGAAPGTLLRFEVPCAQGTPGARASVLPRELARSSSHGLGLHEAIELARALDRLPGRLVCYAIGAEGFAQGRRPSPAASAAAADAAARIAGEIAAAWHHH